MQNTLYKELKIARNNTLEMVRTRLTIGTCIQSSHSSFLFLQFKRSSPSLSWNIFFPHPYL